jgi:hypothetical protein
MWSYGAPTLGRPLYGAPALGRPLEANESDLCSPSISIKRDSPASPASSVCLERTSGLHPRI